MNKATLKAWISAMRPRTLPLSLSGLFLGSSFAAIGNAFSWKIFIFTVITGVLLQTLSDFANDYGDAEKNLDGEDRLGPKRTVSSGQIKPKTMLTAIYFVIGLILLNALILFYVSFQTSWIYWFYFALLGIGAILSAIFYTMGKNPYGYNAKGDYFVFVFFGLVAVLGSYYLYTKSFQNAPILPAIAAGLLSTAVLNINNTRDMQRDKLHNKYTIALRLGEKGARIYQIFLVLTAIILWIVFLFPLLGIKAIFLCLLALPVIISTYKVYTSYEAQILDKQLKFTALGTSFFHIILSLILPILL